MTAAVEAMEVGVIERIGARVQGKKTLGVFATIGRVRRMLPPWLVYSATMMPFGALGRDAIRQRSLGTILEMLEETVA